MNAIMNLANPLLAGVFDKGDAVVIETIKAKYREVLTKKAEKYETHTLHGIVKGVRYVEDQVREIGDYMGYRIKSKNGHYYDHSFFFAYFGYKSLAEIFVKA